MSDDLRDIRRSIDRLSDEELIRIVTTGAADYREEALDYARAEANRRTEVRARGLPQATVVVDVDADWEMVRAKNLNVVVDPMVFRTADVFLRGSKGLAQSPEPKPPETMWNAVRSNIGSLCSFFDTLILEDRIPMYDYGMTFPPDLGAGKHTLIELCNSQEEVLVPVTVGLQAYDEIEQQAVALLGELPNIAEAVATDVAAELSAFDWEWRPDLFPEGEAGNSQQLVDAFRFGGILFSGYAQRTGSDHVLQPKRAKLYLATALGAQRDRDEAALFDELTRLSSESPEGVLRVGDLPPAPTFLPYLLTFEDRTRQDLLKRAFELRHSGAVADYRRWRHDALSNIDMGRAPSELLREIAQISATIKRQVGADRAGATTVNAEISAKVAVVGPLPVPEIKLGISTEIDPARSLGWILDLIPRHRYRKLLMRLVVAQREYWHIDAQLEMLWHAC